MLAHITDAGVIFRAIRSAEFAVDPEQALRWKQHQFNLHRLAESEVISAEDMERTRTVAENYGQSVARRKQGLNGILGAEEQSRREAEVARILSGNSPGNSFESIGDLEAALEHARDVLANKGIRPPGFNAVQHRMRAHRLEAKLNRVTKIMDTPVDSQDLSRVDLNSQGSESIRSKVRDFGNALAGQPAK